MSENMWRSTYDKKGRKYYYHELTREVSWHKPSEFIAEFSDPSGASGSQAIDDSLAMSREEYALSRNGARANNQDSMSSLSSQSASVNRGAFGFEARHNHQQNGMASVSLDTKTRNSSTASNHHQDSVLEEAYEAAESQLRQQRSIAASSVYTNNPSPGTKKVARSKLSLLKKRRSRIGIESSGSGADSINQHQHRRQDPPTSSEENVPFLANDDTVLQETHIRSGSYYGDSNSSRQNERNGTNPTQQEHGEKLSPCPNCGRTFCARALLIHVKSCGKVSKKRKPMDMSKQRLGHLGDASQGSTTRSGAGSQKSTRKPVPKWKKQSGQLRRAMMAAKDKSGAKPSISREPITSEGANGIQDMDGSGALENVIEEAYDDGLIPCPHCNRRFNQKAADRHIPKCKDIKHKPKTLKRGAGGGAGGMQIKKRSSTASARPTPSTPRSIPESSKSSAKNRSTSRRALGSTSQDQSNVDSKTVPRGTPGDHNAKSFVPAPKSTSKASVADASRAGRKAANTQCPHCMRIFSEAVASRHIPKCTSIKNKPKPLYRNRQATVRRPPTAGSMSSNTKGRPPTTTSTRKRPATSRRNRDQHHGQNSFHVGFSSAFDGNGAFSTSHADYEAELAARMEANALQAQQRSLVTKAAFEGGDSHTNRPMSASGRILAKNGRSSISAQNKPPRAVQAWMDRADEPKVNIVESSQAQNAFHEQDELPSELDQLHALGDRKYGKPRGITLGNSSDVYVKSRTKPSRSRTRQDKPKKSGRSAYRLKISAEEQVEQVRHARALNAPDRIAHVPSFVNRRMNEYEKDRMYKTDFHNTVERGYSNAVPKMKEDVEHSAMTAQERRLQQELLNLDSLLANKKVRRGVH